MDYFYDGQVRRYITQFMRVFIGFKWQAGDGTQQQVPVAYGDMTRQVAAIIKDNSENKLATVPKIACYITGLEMDTTRLSDPSFVSKVNIRERRWEDTGGSIEYTGNQGGNYTVERLMPTPYKLTMKADLWTSNTDQKLQLLEQILVLFNPSLELQTTDNYIDWTSLSVLDLKNIVFTSRTVPSGAESEIDVCTMEFEMPIYITPPAKVKKLGVVKSVITNVFTESGDIINLEDLIYNQRIGSFGTSTNRYRVLLFKSATGDLNDHQYDVTFVNPGAVVLAMGLDQKAIKDGTPIDWNIVLDAQGGYTAGSQMYFKQPTGFEMVGQYVINPLDPTKLVVTLNEAPSNTVIDGLTYVDAIIDPYKYNPVEVYGTQANIPVNIRFLMLDDINPNDANTDGPDGWKELNGNDPVIKANSIIKWNGTGWEEIFDPADPPVIPTYITNARTGIQYKWDGEQWLKSFEGEYAPSFWGFLH